MFNLRVDDLDAVLEKLRAAGADIDPKREDHDYGRFAWFNDPEGNRVELWQPPAERLVRFNGLQEIAEKPPIPWEVISFRRARLSSGDNKGIYDQGLDRGLGQNFGHVDVGIAAGGDVDKHHIRGVFRAGGADVQFANGLDCHGSQKEPVRDLNSCRIDQFRAHRASRFSG